MIQSECHVPEHSPNGSISCFVFHARQARDEQARNPSRQDKHHYSVFLRRVIAWFDDIFMGWLDGLCTEN